MVTWNNSGIAKDYYCITSCCVALLTITLLFPLSISMCLIRTYILFGALSDNAC